MLLLLFLVGTASADLYSDATASYGYWEGVITITDMFTNASHNETVSLVIGGDSSLYHGLSAGYFYLLSGSPYWMGATTDTAGYDLAYSGMLTSGTSLLFHEGSLAGSYVSSLLITFADDFMSFTISVLENGVEDGAVISNSITGTFNRVHSPIPGAAWLLGTGLLGLVGLRKRLRN